MSLPLSLPAKPSPLLPLPPLNSSTQKQTLRSLSVKLKSTDGHIIIDRINGGRIHEAVSALDSMARSGSHADLITYSLLLKSCIRSREFGLGKRVHRRLSESGLELDSVLLNSLISLYSKRGDTVEEAENVFDGMGGKRDLVSWSAMISCYANNGMQWKAIGTFLDMLEAGVVPNDYCYTAVIRACSVPETAELGNAVLGFLIKSGDLESNVNVGCGLIDMFVKGMGGDLSSARKVFDRMTDKNVVSWTLMITRLSELGLPGEAVDMFLGMLVEGYMPDRFTITSIMSSCSELGLLSLGHQFHSWSVRSGLASDVCVGCSLVDMYRKCGSLEDSRKVFDSMTEHNVMSWTAMITGYSQSDNAEEAIQLYSRMIQGPIRPNHFTLSGALKACSTVSNVATGMQVYAHAVKFGFSHENYVGNSLISMFSRSGRMEDARKAFDALFQKSLVSYNTIVNAYAKNVSSEESFVLLHEIEDRGVASSAYMYASLLSATASVGAISKGEQIHARVLKTGLTSNQIIGNSLISMYSKCGNVEAAFQVFSDLQSKNVISWTSMIMGFAKHGFGTRALETFDRMLESSTVRPNEITYVAVLSACSHVGLVSEGWRHFKSMQKEHGIVPQMEHYACMVDLLGRSGLLPEALDFIQQMPFAADALVWRTFLSACCVHGKLELGKHAAKMILERDPEDPSAYVLLANLHARLNQWKEVANLRKEMKQKNLIKEAGCSWIEVKNTVHRFYVGDTLHPRARDIFDELDRIVGKIKQLGYVPNTDLSLHDVEDEQKEQYLLQHSEKIAVAFGLISSSSGSPIRVFKNLRVCGDCHSAMKYISMATGREIVVRDSNRFHHFRDGKCSCNEYW